MTLKKFGKNILYTVLGVLGVIGAIAAVVLICFFFSMIMLLFLGLMCLILAIGFIYWAIGYPITIKVDERPVGYIKWFKFYKT